MMVPCGFWGVDSKGYMAVESHDALACLFSGWPWIYRQSLSFYFFAVTIPSAHRQGLLSHFPVER